MGAIKEKVRQTPNSSSSNAVIVGTAIIFLASNYHNPSRGITINIYLSVVGNITFQ